MVMTAMPVALVMVVLVMVMFARGDGDDGGGGGDLGGNQSGLCLRLRRTSTATWPGEQGNGDWQNQQHLASVFGRCV